AGAARLDVSREHGDAFRGLHSGEPDEAQAPGIESAFGRSDADSRDAFFRETIQNGEPPRTFEAYSAGTGRIGTAVDAGAIFISRRHVPQACPSPEELPQQEEP